jgi:hypothetical protein
MVFGENRVEIYGKKKSTKSKTSAEPETWIRKRIQLSMAWNISSRPIHRQTSMSKPPIEIFTVMVITFCPNLCGPE